MSAGQQAVPANNANNASNEGAQKKHMSKAAVAIIAVVVVAIIVVAGVFGFRRLLATHQRRLPLRLRGPPDWRQRQVPAHRHLPRKGRHARRPPHLPGPGRARRRIGATAQDC